MTSTNTTPRCLQHPFASSILDEAQYLTSFLQRAVEELGNSDSIISQHEAMGMSLTFDLLMDKLRCASGELHIPLTGHKE